MATLSSLVLRNPLIPRYPVNPTMLLTLRLSLFDSGSTIAGVAIIVLRNLRAA